MLDNVAQLRQANGRSVGAVFDLVDKVESRCLTWFPDLGLGYYPVENGNDPYDQEYFNRFHRDANTNLGKALMRARHNFVEQHYRGPLIDVGIGSGAFVELRTNRGRPTYGYDVNPAGVEWLEQRKLLVDPYLVRFQAVSLWDVLEHLYDFQSLLANVHDWVFLSLPIFNDMHHAIGSKHFRPTEHYWYFTREGLIYAMRVCGFELVSESNVETELGRDGIGTFAFRRDVNDYRLQQPSV
jgi:hypothetical protein